MQQVCANGASWVQWVALQATCGGVRLGFGYSKNVCLSDKGGWRGGSSMRASVVGIVLARSSP
jgi:hypothetical protein